MARAFIFPGQGSQADLDRIEQEIATEVAEAVEFAENSPYPDPADQGANYMFA